MDDLLECVEESIRARELFQRGQRILLAVSGGLDSMVLLHLLAELSSENSWRLAVGHLNHQLRGQSSNADERLVIRAARKLGVRVVTARADVRRIAVAQRLSVEMAARKARHEFLARTAARLKIRTIALAHHGDDQVELFFLRLLRGAGREGLSGMKWKSPSPADAKIQLVRPLLDHPKTSLAEYARAKGIAFREDASNTSLDFQRNRIRHELLPLLRRRYQPALEKIITRTMDIAEADAEFITQMAKEWLEARNTRDFQELPLALQRRIIQLQLQEHRVTADYVLVEKLRRSSGKAVCVAPNLSVSREPSGALSLRHGEVQEPCSDSMKLELTSRAGECNFGNVTLRWRVERQSNSEIPQRALNREVFDSDKVGKHIVLRHWQPGDRFQPIGMRSAVKLQDLFTNQRIPESERHRLVVGTTASGELFWVEELRISERFKLSHTTTRRLCWQWKRL